MADVIVPVPFVKQEKLYYCGPATLQMLLTALGVNSPGLPPTWQDQLWQQVEANTGATRPSNAPSTPIAPEFDDQKCEMCGGQWKCWATTPGVLEYLINTHQHAGNFSITMHTSEASATATLMDTLDGNLPGVALIRGWQHWLAVEGYRHGSTGWVSVGGRKLNGVFVRDPWETPSVHYIKWSDWKSAYLKFVPCGDYQGRYVVMGGVRVAPPQTVPPIAPTGIRIIDPLEPEKLRLRYVKRIIPDIDAIKFAREARAELADSTWLRHGFAATEPSHALLVQRLDDHDSYYYIVSFKSGDRETARMIIDAHDGHYSEVAAIQEQGQLLPPYVSRRASAERLLSASERVTHELQYQIRAGTIGEHPIPVWKPCGESSSPFLPFHQYSVGNSFVYYRLDGLRFDQLTEGPA
jgi:hypothetical protein